MSIPAGSSSAGYPEVLKLERSPPHPQSSHPKPIHRHDKCFEKIYGLDDEEAFVNWKFLARNTKMREVVSEVVLPAAFRLQSILRFDQVWNLVPKLVVLFGLILIFGLWLSNRTNEPYIKNLASVPGLPIVGNLLQLGTEQPRRLAELSKHYGPVFQIRLGNKVLPSLWYVNLRLI